MKLSEILKVIEESKNIYRATEKLKVSEAELTYFLRKYIMRAEDETLLTAGKRFLLRADPEFNPEKIFIEILLTTAMSSGISEAERETRLGHLLKPYLKDRTDRQCGEHWTEAAQHELIGRGVLPPLNINDDWIDEIYDI